MCFTLPRVIVKNQIDIFLVIQQSFKKIYTCTLTFPWVYVPKFFSTCSPRAPQLEIRGYITVVTYRNDFQAVSRKLYT